MPVLKVMVCDVCGKQETFDSGKWFMANICHVYYSEQCWDKHLKDKGGA